MPKVLSIVWNLIRGGTEGQCARVVLELTQRGQEHRIAVFRPEGFFLDEVQEKCGPVYHVDIRKLRSLHTVRQLSRLKKFIQEEGFDVVHTWDADAAMFGSLAAKQAGIPFITSRRNLAEALPGYKKKWLDWADRGAAAIVVNAMCIQKSIPSCAARPEKVEHIPNIMDTEEFDRLSNAWKPELPNPPIIGMVGRLDPEKDVECFLHAAKLVAAKRPDAHFVIVGDGRERSGLESLGQDLGLASKVRFLGQVDEVYPLLKCFTLGVLTPKANEGLSNSILEYFAAGLPVVATDCGGNRELIEAADAGTVVPVGDAQAVADAILDRLDRDDNGPAVRQYVEQVHAPTQIGDRFLALYRKVVA